MKKNKQKFRTGMTTFLSFSPQQAISVCCSSRLLRVTAWRVHLFSPPFLLKVEEKEQQRSGASDDASRGETAFICHPRQSVTAKAMSRTASLQVVTRTTLTTCYG